MRHKTNIRSIDAHAKRIRGNHDRILRPEKDVLNALALDIAQRPRIQQRFYPPPQQGIVLQTAVHQLRIFPRGAIHDTGTRRPRKLADMRIFDFMRGARLYRKTQIRPRESLYLHKRRLARGFAKPQLRDNVFSHTRGGRCRERQNPHLGANQPNQLIQLQIIRPEVVPPLADAMRLIDGNQRNADRRQKRRERSVVQPFRRNVDKLVVPMRKAGETAAHLLGIERGIDVGRGNAAPLQSVHLILHERNQGRNHQGRSRQEHRRQLVAKRFPGSRRHHNDGIATIDNMANRRQLSGPETLQLKIPAKRIEIDAVWLLFRHVADRAAANRRRGIRLR